MRFILPADIYAAQLNRPDSTFAKAYITKRFEHVIKYIAESIVNSINFQRLSNDYRNLILEDLIQEGMVGLLQAIQRFDPSHKSSACFQTYAIYYIRGRMQNYLRDERKHKTDYLLAKNVFLESSESDEHDFDRVDGNGDEFDPNPEEKIVDHLYFQAFRKKVPDALSYLTLAEREVIEKYFYKGKKLKQIADELRISCPRVAQLKARALCKLKVYFSDFGSL